MECEIVGDPELIGSMEDSADNHRDSNSVLWAVLGALKIEATEDMGGESPSTEGLSQWKWGLRSHTGDLNAIAQ
jgi:hypothetical protein